MRVSRLQLTNFRNHAAIAMAVAPGVVVLAGPNGAGKTNILEAISLLSPGRGLRGSALVDMIRDGAGNGFAVAAHISGSDTDLADLAIGTAVHAEALGRRRVRVNGAEAAATSLSEWLSVLWLTPAMDRLFVEAASQRRRFLDRLVMALEPVHAHHSSRYEAAMRSRTRLLVGDAPHDAHWLGALEAQMAEHGSAVDAARRRLATAMATALAATPETPFAKPHMTLVGPDSSVAVPWDAEALRAALAGSRGRDAAAGRALLGPHRVDLSVMHLATGQVAARCSTGEQKALLLSIILAHGDLVAMQRGARPILLLDELAAHLDPGRRAALFARLTQAGGQVWMTGTELALFDAAPDGAMRWLIEAGEAPRQI